MQPIIISIRRIYIINIHPLIKRYSDTENLEEKILLVLLLLLHEICSISASFLKSPGNLLLSMSKKKQNLNIRNLHRTYAPPRISNPNLNKFVIASRYKQLSFSTILNCSYWILMHVHSWIIHQWNRTTFSASKLWNIIYNPAANWKSLIMLSNFPLICLKKK